MKNVYIYCEGPTEESFINEILYPYFFNVNIRLARYNRSFLLIFNKKNEIRFIGSRFCYWELILIKLSHEAIGQSLLFK